MKILLDECITKRLKKYFENHLVLTVSDCDWSGTKNGALMRLCEENNFDIFLTIDKNLIYQQNYSNFKPTIVVINSDSSKLEHLIPFVNEFEKLLPTFKPNSSYILNL